MGFATLLKFLCITDSSQLPTSQLSLYNQGCYFGEKLSLVWVADTILEAVATEKYSCLPKVMG